MSSKYTKTMAEAYAEVLEQRRMTGAQRREAQAAARERGNPVKDAVGAVTSRVGQNLQRVTQPGKMKSDTAKALDAADETSAQRTARREKVGLAGNAGPERAKASQKAAQPKLDAVAQRRKAGEVPNRVTPDPKYKEQEQKLSAAAEKSTPVKADTPAPARKPQSSDMDANYRTWAKANPGLAKKVVDKGPRQAGYEPIKSVVNKTPTPKQTSSMGSAASKVSAPKFNTSTPAVKTPKINTPKMNTSSVKSPTPSFSAPKPAAAPKPMSRLDKATTGIKPMADQFEFKALADAYDKMYQLDELFPGAAGGLGAAVGGAAGVGQAVGAGASGAIKGKDTKDKIKKAIGSGTGAAVGSALGGPLGGIIGGGIGDAVTSEAYHQPGGSGTLADYMQGASSATRNTGGIGKKKPGQVKGVKEAAEAAYEAWLQEQITAGKNYNSSGLDLRSPGQKMDNIKKNVKQNDKIQGLIQPPPGL